MWVRATHLAVLQRNGGLKRVTHPHQPLYRVLVLLENDGQVVAIFNECPHHGAEFTAGNRGPGWIECPLHAWRFDVHSGYAPRIPGCRIPTFPTRIVDGIVEVELPDFEPCT